MPTFWVPELFPSYQKNYTAFYVSRTPEYYFRNYHGYSKAKKKHFTIWSHKNKTATKYKKDTPKNLYCDQPINHPSTKFHADILLTQMDITTSTKLHCYFLFLSFLIITMFTTRTTAFLSRVIHTSTPKVNNNRFIVALQSSTQKATISTSTPVSAAAGTNQAEVVLVGCGAPNRGMGWYHAVQMLDKK
jgi:hypothetical protein